MRKISFFLIVVILLASGAFAEDYISLTGEQIHEAEKSPIYHKYQVTCNLCSSVEENARLEDALKTDMKYANKYGVINYSRRDRAVQAIKRNDIFIAKGKSEYSRLYKKKFNKKECDLVNSDDCEGALFELSAKILGQLPWAADDIYPKP